MSVSRMRSRTAFDPGGRVRLGAGALDHEVCCREIQACDVTSVSCVGEYDEADDVGADRRRPPPRVQYGWHVGKCCRNCVGYDVAERSLGLPSRVPGVANARPRVPWVR